MKNVSQRSRHIKRKWNKSVYIGLLSSIILLHKHTILSKQKSCWPNISARQPPSNTLMNKWLEQIIMGSSEHTYFCNLEKSTFLRISRTANLTRKKNNFILHIWQPDTRRCFNSIDFKNRLPIKIWHFHPIAKNRYKYIYIIIVFDKLLVIRQKTLTRLSLR